MKEKVDLSVYISEDRSLPASDTPVRYPVNAMLEKTASPEDEIKVVLLVKNDKYSFSKKNEAAFVEEINRAVSASGAKIDIVTVDTEFSQNKEVHERLMGRLVDEIEENSHIIVDITYGPKDIPVVIFAALGFAEKFLGCDIDNIVYGQASFSNGHVYNQFSKDGIYLKRYGSEKYEKIENKKENLLHNGDELFLEIGGTQGTGIECGGSQYSFIRTARFMNTPESLIEEILNCLEDKEFVRKETGKPWTLTEDGGKYLNGETADRASRSSIYGYMFVNAVKRDYLPYFYQGDINQISLFRGEMLPERLTLNGSELDTFKEIHIKRTKLRDAYLCFFKTDKTSRKYNEGDISLEEAIDQTEDLFEGINDFDEATEEETLPASP